MWGNVDEILKIVVVAKYEEAKLLIPEKKAEMLSCQKYFVDALHFSAFFSLIAQLFPCIVGMYLTRAMEKTSRILVPMLCYNSCLVSQFPSILNHFPPFPSFPHSPPFFSISPHFPTIFPQFPPIFPFSPFSHGPFGCQGLSDSGT